MERNIIIHDLYNEYNFINTSTSIRIISRDSKLNVYFSFGSSWEIICFGIYFALSCSKTQFAYHRIGIDYGVATRG